MAGLRDEVFHSSTKYPVWFCTHLNRLVLAFLLPGLLPAMAWRDKKRKEDVFYVFLCQIPWYWKAEHQSIFTYKMNLFPLFTLVMVNPLLAKLLPLNAFHSNIRIFLTFDVSWRFMVGNPKCVNLKLTTRWLTQTILYQVALTPIEKKTIAFGDKYA